MLVFWGKLLIFGRRGRVRLGALSDLFILRGPVEYIRSDYRPEFIAQNVCDLIAAVGAKTAHIELGLPWKTDTAKASMQGSETNYSMATCSIP